MIWRELWAIVEQQLFANDECIKNSKIQSLTTFQKKQDTMSFSLGFIEGHKIRINIQMQFNSWKFERWLNNDKRPTTMYVLYLWIKNAG